MPQVFKVHWADDDAYVDVAVDKEKPHTGPDNDVRVVCLNKTDTYSLTARAKWDDGRSTRLQPTVQNRAGGFPELNSL